MTKILKTILLGVIVMTFFLWPASNHTAASFDNTMVVGFDEPKSTKEVAKELNLDEKQIKKINDINAFQVKNLDKVQQKKINEAKNSQHIKYAEPDYQYKTLLTPNDSYFYDQWGLKKISSENAWNTTTGSNSNIIAIVDTGINGLHEDLTGKVMAGYAFLDLGTNEYPIDANTNSDDHGHGTAVGGVASAQSNNSMGVAGVDWQARLMPVKVLSADGYGYSSDIANGITYAANNGAKVINLSLGGQYPSTAIEEAINYAYNSKGCIIVAASGNDDSSIIYPAKYENVIATGATDSSDNRCQPASCGYGSNYGPELDVVAPGTSIRTTQYQGGYASYGGTSMAAPFVSGLVSLVWAQNPSLSNSEIFARIKNNASKVSAMSGSNFTNEYGYGRIDAAETISPTASTDPNRYHYELNFQNSYPTIIPGRGYNFTINAKNTGTAVWYKNVVHLGTSQALDHTPAFVREDSENPFGHPSGWVSPNRIEMQQSQVAPGETATFSFWMSAPLDMSASVYREYFRLVAEGVTWMEDYGIFWDVIVKSPVEAYYPCQWINQNNYPTIDRGQGYNFVVNIKNTGNVAWHRNIVHLATNQPEDHIPGFVRADLTDLYGHPSGWVSPNRVEMQEDVVYPGNNATFSFWMSAPTDKPSGTYKEYFRMVADGVTWMQDMGIFWEITVN
ncbi:MAG: S8 family peptidase [Patescibacteria group bacterium]|nr:S8 family peptidase [Patescibacteria group bacterium]